MSFTRRLAAIALFTMGCSVWVMAGQAPAPAPAAAAKVVLTPEQMEAFLVNAKIIRSRPAGSGVTGTRRVTLSDGVLTHDAQTQIINEDKQVYKVQGYTEFNFRDCFCYNIAAYRLARLLEMDGKPAAITWWIDDVVMDEEARRKKNLTDPNPQRGGHYKYRQEVFDELIQNKDRNLGNFVYTSDWTMWMIDHTRAFRLAHTLLKPEQLLRVDRQLYQNMKKLTVATVTAAVGSSLTKGEIEAVIGRRDAIVKLFEGKMAGKGEGLVLYDAPAN
jgi:hypothetical protein